MEEFYKRYEAYVGSKTTKTVDMVVEVNDVEALQKDLQKEFALNSALSSVAGNMALGCGLLLPVANAALITDKHIGFEKEPGQESEQEPCKEAGKEPAKNFHLIIAELWRAKLACGAL